MQDPYGALVALVRFDNNTHAREHEIALKKTGLLSITKNIQEAEQGLVVAREASRLLEKRQHEIDLELRTCDQEDRRISSRLDTAGRGKEFEALTHERAALESRRTILEQDFETVWEQLAAAEKAILRAKNHVENIARESAPQVVGLEQEIREMEQKIGEHLSERETFLKTVRPEWIALYDQMRTRFVNPFVPLMSNGTCGGCGSPVARTDIASVERHQIVSCQVCRRILYDGHVAEGADATQIMG
ncbi:MAG: hypothetical protein UV79_C0001G0053 [candidate division TM6 bacterium GW2011_GWF2_43_17]|nr:MAG: hypothetical protein UV79_C0001G0053 [candidate division TM6 bacterium GW2011_GWF2_43_17]HAU30311.1 hypothetical protein [Candidatus Dependentiae bacterium]